MSPRENLAAPPLPSARVLAMSPGAAEEESHVSRPRRFRTSCPVKRQKG